MNEDDSRRLHRRHESTVEVSVVFDGDETLGFARNLSLGGMFVDFAVPPPVGSSVQVQFRLPALTETIDVPMTVRWTNATGAGMSFGSLRARHVWALNEYFRHSDA